MRILMLSPSPAVQGPIPVHTPVLVDALRELGCEVVMEPWGRHRDRESVAEKLISRSLDILRIRRRLRRQRYDVMVVKTSHEWRSLLGDLPLLAATRGCVASIVVQFHGGRSDLLVSPGQRGFKLASAMLFHLCDGILVLSTEEALDGRRFWPPGRFRVVANPYAAASDNGAGPRPGAADGTECDGASLILLFVGRLIKEKGIFEMLSAFATVSRHHDCRLVIAGDGPEREVLRRRVTELGLDEKVTLAGFLRGAALAEAYQAADVFVFPSYREGFPTAITEALAAGLPIVTTRTRGMADHLVEEQNTLFVAPGDTPGLTVALARITRDGRLRERMAAENRAKVADFAPANVARQYLDTLTEIVDERS